MQQRIPVSGKARQAPPKSLPGVTNFCPKIIAMAAVSYSLDLLRESILREIENWIDQNPHCPSTASIAVDRLVVTVEAMGRP